MQPTAHLQRKRGRERRIAGPNFSLGTRPSYAGSMLHDGPSLRRSCLIPLYHVFDAVSWHAAAAQAHSAHISLATASFSTHHYQSDRCKQHGLTCHDPYARVAVPRLAKVPALRCNVLSCSAGRQRAGSEMAKNAAPRALCLNRIRAAPAALGAQRFARHSRC